MTEENFLTHTVTSLKSDLENKATEFKKAKEFYELYLRQNKIFVCDKENDKFYISKFDTMFLICIEKILNEYSCKFTPLYQEFFGLHIVEFKETDLENFNKKFTETLNKFLETVFDKVSNLNPLDISFYNDEENSGFTFQEVTDRFEDIRLQIIGHTNKFKNFVTTNNNYKIMILNL